MELLDFDVRVEVQTGDTSQLNVVGDEPRRRPSGPSSAARASASRRSSTS